MKLLVELDGQECSLELQKNGQGSEFKYTLSGAFDANGMASLVEVSPGVYSVLIGARSVQVRVVPSGESLEVWSGSVRRQITVSDSRDRAGRHAKSSSGPQEIRAQMPGKVIKILVSAGDTVKTGQGVIIVEAMKMQNEMKSPKDGRIAKVSAVEGSTVAAGQPLLVIE